MNPATENLLGVRVEQKLSFDEMFADLDMPDTDETVSRSFLTNEITRFGRVLSVTLALTAHWTARARHRSHSRSHRAAPSG